MSRLVSVDLFKAFVDQTDPVWISWVKHVEYYEMLTQKSFSTDDIVQLDKVAPALHALHCASHRASCCAARRARLASRLALRPGPDLTRLAPRLVTGCLCSDGGLQEGEGVQGLLQAEAALCRAREHQHAPHGPHARVRAVKSSQVS